MWYVWFSPVLPLVVSSAAVNIRRQIPGFDILSPDGLMPLLPNLFGSEEPRVVRSDKSWNLKPQFRAGAKRELIRWGPFEIPGLPNPSDEFIWTPGDAPSMDPVGKVVTATLAEGFCRDCTVLAGKADLAFANGSRADISSGIYLHHLLTIDRSKPPPTFISYCPTLTGEGEEGSPILPVLNPFGMLFLGGGNDGSNVRFSTSDPNIQSGYFIKNNTFAMTADIVNYNHEQKDIFIVFDVEYLPGKIGTDAGSTLLSVTGCSRPGFDNFESTLNITSSNFKIRENGWIVSARGHLHDGGEAMQMFINEKLVCNSTATYGGKAGTVKMNGREWQTISSMSECNKPVKVENGDYLRMVSIYNTTKHPLRESDGIEMESMGMFSVTFASST